MSDFILRDVVSLTADHRLSLLDQTRLPGREVFFETDRLEEICDSIAKLKVRGAPAIGVAAAMGLAVVFNKKVSEREISNLHDALNELRAAAADLKHSRPTAVNLEWAVNRMITLAESVVDGDPEMTPKKLSEMLLEEAVNIKEEDVRMCRAISENGLTLIHRGSTILTHCNAGHLAVSRYGTALGPIHLAQQKGLNPKVFADETRPLLQGARLTAYELQKSGVDVTLICDNMAASMMAAGLIDMVFVGCDRIAANGDFANKIGTLSVAVNARYFGIPFYVLGPSSTYDRKTPTGKDIVIEERSGDEIAEMFYSERMAPRGISLRNPAFDVTPASLVTAYITEKGVFESAEALADSFRG